MPALKTGPGNWEVSTLMRHLRVTVQSRCERSIEDIVIRAGRPLTALDVYRELLEVECTVSLSSVRRCLFKLYTNGRIQRVELPRTGRCIYTPGATSGEHGWNTSFVPPQLEGSDLIQRSEAVQFPV